MKKKTLALVLTAGTAAAAMLLALSANANNATVKLAGAKAD